MSLRKDEQGKGDEAPRMMRAIPDLVGYYATVDGEIVSMRSGCPRKIVPRLRDGYLVVTVSVVRHSRRERHRLQAHRLILIAFRGPPPVPAAQCRHLDGCRTNNHPSNLAWGTAKDNASDAIRHGTLGKGMRSRRRKLGELDVAEIRRRMKAGEHTKKVARDFGVSDYYPSSIANGRHWAA